MELNDEVTVREKGVLTLSEAVWAEAKRRAEVIRPLTDLSRVGRAAAPRSCGHRQEGYAPQAPAYLCDPAPGARRRVRGYLGIARACEPGDHADLHARQRGPDGGGGGKALEALPMLKVRPARRAELRPAHRLLPPCSVE